MLPSKPQGPGPDRIGRKAQNIRNDTLIPLLHEHMIPMEKIEQDYPAFTSIVRVLIGIVPRCDAYLEIWPTAFKSYNLIVPNLMNVPFNQLNVGPGWGKGSALAGLATFVVSRAAECSYCSAHTCSFALRRGASKKALLKGMYENGLKPLSEAEEAVIAVARSLGRIPCELTQDERLRLLDAVGEETAQSVVLSMCAMGYLNKVMDSLGVELEEETYLETKSVIAEDYANSKAGSMLDSKAGAVAPPGKDSLWQRLSMVPHVPGALMLDGKYTSGVPSSWPAVGAYLKAHVGYDFPVLSELNTATLLGQRAVRAIATVLRDNLDGASSVVSLPVKGMAAVVFTHVVGAERPLAGDACALAAVLGVTPAHIRACQSLAAAPVAPTLPDADATAPLRALGSHAACWLLLARAIAPSPAAVSPALVSLLQHARVPPEGVVELVNFVAVWQLLHRLDAFFNSNRRNHSSGLAAASISG